MEHRYSKDVITKPEHRQTKDETAAGASATHKKEPTREQQGSDDTQGDNSGSISIPLEHGNMSTVHVDPSQKTLNTLRKGEPVSGRKKRKRKKKSTKIVQSSELQVENPGTATNAIPMDPYKVIPNQESLDSERHVKTSEVEHITVNEIDTSHNEHKSESQAKNSSPTSNESIVGEGGAIHTDPSQETLDTAKDVGQTSHSITIIYDRELTVEKHENDDIQEMHPSVPITNHNDKSTEEQKGSSVNRLPEDEPIPERRQTKSKRRRKKTKMDQTTETQAERPSPATNVFSMDHCKVVEEPNTENKIRTSNTEQTSESEVKTSSCTSNVSTLGQGDAIHKDPSQETLDSGRNEEPVPEHKKKKSRKKKKRTKNEHTSELQDGQVATLTSVTVTKDGESNGKSCEPGVEKPGPTSNASTAGQGDAIHTDPRKEKLETAKHVGPTSHSITIIYDRELTVENHENDDIQEMHPSVPITNHNDKSTEEQKGSSVNRLPEDEPIPERRQTKSKRRRKKTKMDQTTETQAERPSPATNVFSMDHCKVVEEPNTENKIRTSNTEQTSESEVKTSSCTSNVSTLGQGDAIHKDPSQETLDSGRNEEPVPEHKKKKSRKKKKRTKNEHTSELQDGQVATLTSVTVTKDGESNGESCEPGVEKPGPTSNASTVGQGDAIHTDTSQEKLDTAKHVGPTSHSVTIIYDRELTVEKHENDDIQEMPQSVPITNHNGESTEEQKGSSVNRLTEDEHIPERRKRKSKRRRKKTNMDQTTETQVKTSSSASNVSTPVQGDVIHTDPSQETLDSGRNETSSSISITNHTGESTEEQQGCGINRENNESKDVKTCNNNNNNNNKVRKTTSETKGRSYADCVKTGKIKHKVPKHNRGHVDITEQYPVEGKLYSTTAESDVESISSFQFDDEEGDLVNSDMEKNEESDIYIGDDTETWFEKSRRKYDFPKDDSGLFEDDVLDNSILTDGVELTDVYMEKFTRQSFSLKRDNFYGFKSERECMELCKSNPNLYVCCQLEIQSPHRAVATLLNPRKNLERIEILGRFKCGQAFTADEVVVEILQKVNRAKDTSGREKDKKTLDAYGKVIGIIERVRHKDIEHPVFIATQDPNAGHLMLPICKTIPKISVLNKNIKERYPTQMMHKVEVYDYVASKGILQYKESQDIKPDERDQYRFLVCYLHWGEKYVYPRGAVIALMKTDVNDIRRGLRIIGIQNQVPTHYNESTIGAVQRLIENSQETANSNRLDLTDKINAFTIDPPHSKDLDDALSVEDVGSDTYLIGVHISDVTAAIPLDSDIDKEARSRCSTYYSIPRARNMHMLPEPLSQDMLSLLPNTKRAAISVFFTVNKYGVIEETRDIRRTFIRSSKRLTYQEVQAIIDETALSSDRLHRDIRCLNELAQHIRRDRLKGALHAYPVEFDFSVDTNDILHNIDAHNLVEEFMIMANHSVGRYLVNAYSDVVPLRCQSNPESDALSSWLSKNTHIADIIVALQDLKLNTSSVTRTLSISNAPKSRWNRLLPIQNWVWKAIVNAAERNDIGRVKQLIGSDDLHPQQSFALQEWMSFQETASYKCSGSDGLSKSGGHHFSLGLDNYVHFTSPIRRYVDIVIHRLLHAALDGLDKLPYTKEDIDDICDQMNQARNRAKIFQKQCDMLLLSTKLRRCPQKLVGFVEDMSDEGVTLHFPGLKHVPVQKRMLKFNLLYLNSQPQRSEDVDLIPNTSEKRELISVKWHRRIYLHRGVKRKQQNDEDKESDNSTVKSVDPHQRTKFLKYTAWVEILTALLDRNNDILIQVIDETETDGKFGALRKYVQSSLKAVQDVSCENQTSVFVNPICKFKLPFHLNQTVAVHMTAEYDRGTLYPYIQVFDMTPNVSFCLQHVDNPVKVLARYSTVPSKLEYKDVQNYIKSWLPIIQMEAATNTVRNEESATICGVPIQFRGRNGKFYLNTHYCKMREIEFGNTELEIFKEDTEEVTRGNRVNDAKKKELLKEIVCSNYVCIRCPVRGNEQKKQSQSAQGRITDEKRIWIGHGEFTHKRSVKVEKFGHCFEVHFKLHEDNAPAPMKVAEISDGCSLEILSKSKVDRRTESLMKLLPEATSLARAIALAKRIPVLDDLHEEIAKEIPRDIEIDSLPRNNHQQNNAIENALTSRFSLIQGPPGTGKTFTGIKLIYLFNLFNRKFYEKTHERRYLVFSGPSNKSVDLVANQVLQRLSQSDLAPRIIRMYGQAYEFLDFPVPGKISCSHRSIRDSKPDEALKGKGVVLHHVIRESGKTYADELRSFDRKFKAESYTASIEEIDKYQEILSKATQEELQNYDVILCTTSMAGNPKLLKATKGKVYQCIIDECGMCTEPECMVPPIATRAEQVVLIGDHKQLQPIILCKEAGELGLATSLFERYAKLRKKMEKLNMKYTMLVWQYRMNPKICEFPSRRFYDGKLKTANSKYWIVDQPLRIWKNTNRNKHEFSNKPNSDKDNSSEICKKSNTNEHIPLVFCHIEGSEEVLTVSTEEGNERSRKNKEEADHVAKVFKYLRDVEKVNTNYIQIITQYNAQRHAIQETLTKENIINIKINTVVKSQGSEWDYVIFSTVRSLPRYLIEHNPTIGWCRQNLGFITDQHQINVALTRARKGLIIIGNKHLLRCDEVWRDLIRKYEDEDLVYTPQQFPPSPRRRRDRPTRPPRLK
ncbi:helicase with zinc finger domain 2-like isoform X4 [Pecten maximus]|uniref:helicase with zinc finger domain 2-like isoform X4 n=1 Tax=Pecten maximus TaxID=6579 RepID=UPI001458BFAB|nr:helicase with zinc finger domain 2-like isoform X4 [Pecten maximus]